MNPTDQFIEIAPDCPLTKAVVPRDKGDQRSIAAQVESIVRYCLADEQTGERT